MKEEIIVNGITEEMLAAYLDGWQYLMLYQRATNFRRF